MFFTESPSPAMLYPRCCICLDRLWQRRVEKWGSHREHQIGAFGNERDMRRARYDSELGFWQAGQIARHSTPDQAEELDHVLRPHGIGIPMTSSVGAAIARIFSSGQANS